MLNNVSCTINNKDRVGLVGSNGVGKSTLLRILMAQEEVSTGTITYAPSVEVGYLPQTTPDFYGRTIQDLILESVGNLRVFEERMHTLEAAMALATEEQLQSLLEEYNTVSTQFQDRGGYDIDYKIDTIMEGLQLTYLPRDTDEIQSQEVIKFSHLSKSFGERHILADLNGTLGGKARILLTGPNGAGKTTLFKLIMGLEMPDAGVTNVVPSAKIGYLAQEPETLDMK